MFDLEEPAETRDGRKVRIYATDGGGEWPVHGAYLAAGPGEPYWVSCVWTRGGVCVGGMRDKDLINIGKAAS